MKKYKIIFYVFTMLSLVSCEDILDQQPYGVISEDLYYQTEGDAISAVTATYSRLQRILFTNEWKGLDYIPDIMSPDAESHPGFAGLKQTHEYTNTPENPEVASLWVNLYNGVYLANQGIERINEMPEDVFSDGMKSRLLGECYFLRAWYNLRITQLWGDAPLVVQTLSLDNFYIPSSPQSEFFIQIKNDLLEAEDRLPLVSEYDSNNVGRATKGAAQSYLGYLYLLMDNPGDAVIILKRVVDSNKYALVDNYESLFNGTNENSSESVFEIQFASNTGDNVGSFTPQGYGAGGEFGWGFTRPTADLVSEFEITPKEDPRRAASILNVGEVYEGKVFKGIESPHGNRKWITGLGREAAYPWYSPVNQSLMRYADVLLLYAEALNKTSASSDAVGYINKVRARASVSMPALDLGLSPEKVLEAIIHERRVELCLEGKSGFDLRRLLSQSELVNYFHNKGYTNFSYPRDLFLPIPQSEIDKSDGSLEQNPSWK
ncbi:MAG: RagB/SusD family nutrient uptake outer membrane protein [Lutibacter sp.]|nr:RagB/SusD family nutrient uptake outer membrane protein [Lutibacter sp.]